MYKFILVLFGCVSQLFAANGFVQGVGAQTSTSSCAATLTGIVSGNAMVFHVHAYTETATCATPTSTGDTWTLIRTDTRTQTSSRYCSYYSIAGSTGNRTVSMTIGTSGSFNNCFLWELSGLGATPTVNGAGTIGTVSGTVVTSGASTTTAGDLRIAYGGNMAVDTTCTAGSGFTLPASTAGTISGGGSTSCIEYDLNAAGGSQTASLTFGVSAEWAIMQIFFTPTGGSAPAIVKKKLVIF